MKVNNLLSGMEAAAREAGRIMLEADHIREGVIEKEGHGNFVTTYDKLVQNYLSDTLGRLLPEASFIGEEDGADRYSEQNRHGFSFCVDPIDGTTNFLCGYPPSVTSIALFRDGLPYLGVVYNPYWNMLFSGIRGEGAFLNGAQIFSSSEPLSRSLAVFGTAAYNPELSQRTFALCSAYLPRCIDLRRSGSAAWDLCSVAAGKTGLYFELQIQLWDYAAGGLIAEEAGCALTTTEGNPLTWDGPSSILCASRGVAREMYLPE